MAEGLTGRGPDGPARARSGRALAAGGGGGRVDGDHDLGGPEHAVVVEVAAKRLRDDRVVLDVAALHPRHGFVASRIEGLADGGERPHPDTLERREEVPVDQLDARAK